MHGHAHAHTQCMTYLITTRHNKSLHLWGYEIHYYFIICEQEGQENLHLGGTL